MKILIVFLIMAFRTLNFAQSLPITIDSARTFDDVGS